MAQFGHSILNPNVVQPFMTDDDPWAHEWLANNTTGTESGPYLLERWERGNQIVLAKNPNYWNADAVQNDRVILQIIPDASSRLAQLQAGAVDIAIEIPTRDIAGLENDPNIKVERFTTRAVGYIGMNNTVAPFDNVQVRQAISYAIPYNVIINNVQNGLRHLAHQPHPKWDAVPHRRVLRLRAGSRTRPCAAGRSGLRRRFRNHLHRP